jgi:hydrogenase nickel incorporation protein HypA/HybF
MHELRIAQEIINITQREMFARKLDKISKIGLKIGALSGIDPEALSFGFEASIADSELAGARLEIEFIPVKGRCDSCRADFGVDDFLFICPHCGSNDVTVTEGEELNIAYFIGE